MVDECAVCLEPLEGTIVHMACCHNKVHIQCYLPKCPLCRSILPLPREAVAVPVPSAPPVVLVVRPQVHKTFAFIATVVGVGLYVYFTY